MNFVHIGAGAGDKDPSSNFRDGFSELVKKQNNKSINVIVVEANPNNIKKLEETWKDFRNVKILNFAIVPINTTLSKIKLYYSEDDGPHYQLLSKNIDHIKRYFPNSKINHLHAPTLTIKNFFKNYCKNLTIESFSIDVEGADFEIVMDIDLNEYDIKNISIEYLHLSKIQKKKLINKFIENNYSYNGFGIDHNDIDWLFTKKKSKWNNLIAKILPYIHRIHYKRLNKIIKKL